MDDSTNLMGPTHPEWIAFCTALAAGLTVEGKDSWYCQHDHRHTRVLLATKWPEIDVEDTLELFLDCGGYCDCEVLLDLISTTHLL
jgi:hypothetical protein